MIKKKILLNASMVAKTVSGVGVYTIQQINHLVPLLEADNISFHIYSYSDEFFHSKENVKQISLGILLDKIFLKTLTLHRHIWNIVYLFFLRNNYELFYSFSSHGTLFHKQQIITIHDLICFAFPQQHKGQYRYFKQYIPLLIKRSKHIVTISKFTQKEVIKHYGIDDFKTTIIYNGVDHFKDVLFSNTDAEWVKTLTGNKPFCMVVGASYHHKNVETIIQVARQIVNKEIRFVLVGRKDDYFAYLQKMAANLNLTNIIFLNYVSKYRLAALYKQANLNLYLSLYEGFGFPPAEALFFGTPTLLSNQEALREVYNGFAYFTDALNVKQILEKVKELFFNPKEPPEKFLALYEKFNWHRSAQQTFQLIMQTIKAAR